MYANTLMPGGPESILISFPTRVEREFDLVPKLHLGMHPHSAKLRFAPDSDLLRWLTVGPKLSFGG